MELAVDAAKRRAEEEAAARTEVRARGERARGGAEGVQGVAQTLRGLFYGGYNRVF